MRLMFRRPLKFVNLAYPDPFFPFLFVVAENGKKRFGYADCEILFRDIFRSRILLRCWQRGPQSLCGKLGTGIVFCHLRYIAREYTQ